MATDRDIKKDRDTAYHEASGHWGQFLAEAKKDLECHLGKQWDASDESYLKGQGREALVFNKVRRVNKLLTGYQRKNRLSLKIEPAPSHNIELAISTVLGPGSLVQGQARVAPLPEAFETKVQLCRPTRLKTARQAPP